MDKKTKTHTRIAELIHKRNKYGRYILYGEIYFPHNIHKYTFHRMSIYISNIHSTECQYTYQIYIPQNVNIHIILYIEDNIYSPQ